MQKPRKIPQRMCCGCSEHKDKRALIRIVRSPEGVISLDRTGKKPGRGAYLCPAVDCLQKARKTKRLERALEAQIPAEVYDTLQEELSSE